MRYRTLYNCSIGRDAATANSLVPLYHLQSFLPDLAGLSVDLRDTLGVGLAYGLSHAEEPKVSHGPRQE